MTAKTVSTAKSKIQKERTIVRTKSFEVSVDSHSAEYAVCPGSEGAVLKIVGCKRLVGANPMHGACGIHISAYPLKYLVAARMILLRTERDRPAAFR